jgi:hypothetical protein
MDFGGYFRRWTELGLLEYAADLLTRYSCAAGADLLTSCPRAAGAGLLKVFKNLPNPHQRN